MDLRIFLAVGLCVVCSRTFSQNYVSLVEEGKVWNMCLTWTDRAGNTCSAREKWEIDGDTVIGDVTYKKYYEHGTYVCAFREEDKRVYACKGNEEWMLYDFSKKEGDRIANAQAEYEVTGNFSLSNGLLQCIELTSLEDPCDINYWIEGVGGLCGPLYPFYYNMDGGVQLTVISCLVQDKILYQSGDMPNSISNSWSSVYDVEPACYDLQGRKVEGKPSRGLYIIGGKKRVVK